VRRPTIQGHGWLLHIDVALEAGAAVLRPVRSSMSMVIMIGALWTIGLPSRWRPGLEAGANDYVTKPFKFAVLLARIRAQLRQYEASEDAIFQIGPYTFRPGSKLLTSEKGSKLKLTEKETAILRYLYRAGQKVVGRDTLLQEVWGYNSNVTTHTLETHIYRLRQKIETDPSSARILVTEPGGYKLMP
jgi:DNA-binding response OmpR family regulator